MVETVKSHSILKVKKGFRVLLVLIAVMVVTLLMGWAGMEYPEKMSALNQWIMKTKAVWLVWRGCLYVTLGWGGWKIWQRTIQQPEYRVTLIRVMVVSLLFILLGEYALSGSIEVTQ
ncbi:hypothetical protein [Xenorhabdus thuongxuanensis]|uniref:Exported protein n=1 Tax=Xenorhabdus thuongxuanensis TaxID=1873484 RepID=A0A1Q5TJ24_9GAMM|nr:hypothetical protein [Xenorhabdus thuongxuanensis]OKP00214.1 exported protein [Xenorhabdus thuongxuanensis]